MLRIRRLEEAIARRYTEWEMRCPVHLCIGQEAIAVGVCEALRRDDQVFSGHRAHGHYLAKGGAMTPMLAEMYGRATGCCGGIGGSMHLIDRAAGFMGAVPIVAATIPIAVGAAWAAALKGDERVVAVFFGDGAFEEGVVHESIAFAVLHRLPVLFVCENNHYACQTPLGTRRGSAMHAVAAAQGCQVVTGDGNDVDFVAAAAARAAASARVGEGPWFLEFETYRWLEHCGPNDDDGLGYRPAGELAAWQARCPLAAQARALRAAGVAEDWFAAVEAELTAEIEAAFAAARAAPLPDYARMEGLVHG
ncbi:MAG: thiamine pyrophosphate-dependent dehydrogenase E1 component subunit alpha [Pseudomonadota bacterium]